MGMKIHIKATNFEVTPALREYVEQKVNLLAPLVARWEEDGELEVWVEVARTTNHHRKGEVYATTIDLGLPEKTLRAEEHEEDARAAIDRAKDTLQREIVKYKELRSP